MDSLRVSTSPSANLSRSAEIVRALPSQVPELRAVRSTLISSSLEALRAEDLFSRYSSALPTRYHEAVLHTLSPTWLTPEIAMAHYRAIDALNLHSDDAVGMGRTVGQRLHGTFLETILRSARRAGFTLWDVAGKLDTVWSRVFDGAAIGLWKLGPREAYAEIRGLPLLESRYFRAASRGVIAAAVEAMARRCYVRELHTVRSPEGIDLIVSWV